MSYMFITAELSLPALWMLQKTVINWRSLELIVTRHKTENVSVFRCLNFIVRKQYIVVASIRCIIIINFIVEYLDLKFEKYFQQCLLLTLDKITRKWGRQDEKVINTKEGENKIK